MYDILRITPDRTEAFDTFEGTIPDALAYATEYAREHADRIGVPITHTSTGASFTTSNNTPVAYGIRFQRTAEETRWDNDHERTSTCSCGRGMKKYATACSLGCHRATTAHLTAQES